LAVEFTLFTEQFRDTDKVVSSSFHIEEDSLHADLLTYWYRGKRYRPVLGYNLRLDQERESALSVISIIHANTVEIPGRLKQGFPGVESKAILFSEFVSIYL